MLVWLMYETVKEGVGGDISDSDYGFVTPDEDYISMESISGDEALNEKYRAVHILPVNEVTNFLKEKLGALDSVNVRGREAIFYGAESSYLLNEPQVRSAAIEGNREDVEQVVKETGERRW